MTSAATWTTPRQPSRARARSSGTLSIPAGYYTKWTGQYELLADMEARMKILIPLALLVTIVLFMLRGSIVAQ